MAVLYNDAGDECYIITIEWQDGVEMAWLQWRGRCNREIWCWLVHRTWWPDDGSLSEASAAMLANQSCRIRSLIHRQGVAVMVCPYLPWLGRSRSQRERKCLRHGLVSRLRKSLSWSEQRCPLWVLIVPFYHYEWVLFLSRFPGRPFCEHGRGTIPPSGGMGYEPKKLKPFFCYFGTYPNVFPPPCSR